MNRTIEEIILGLPGEALIKARYWDGVAGEYLFTVLKTNDLKSLVTANREMREAIEKAFKPSYLSDPIRRAIEAEDRLKSLAEAIRDK